MSNGFDFPPDQPVQHSDPPEGPIDFFRELQPSRRLTDDAVVVIPGIMGSELVHTTSGKRLWGLEPRALTRFWMAPWDRISPLCVTHENANAVKPTRLLQWPIVSPVLGGFEPYTYLVRGVRQVVRHPSAVLEFPYDWRLSVAYNATRLAEAVDVHVRNWRVRSRRPDAQVKLVAHSMGGLICQAMASIPGAYERVSATITLGTPFEGAAETAIILGTGEGKTLPAERLRRLAITMPGVYDLLAVYRSVDMGDDVRELTPADVGAIGGDVENAARALDRRRKDNRCTMVNHMAFVGINQPTVCSVSIDNGCVSGLSHTFGVDRDSELLRHDSGVPKRFLSDGDGTVPRNSALPVLSAQVTAMPQQHGPMVRSDDVIEYVKHGVVYGVPDSRARLGADESTTSLSESGLGLQVPDVISLGAPFTVAVSGVASKNDIRCKVENVETRDIVARPMASTQDGRIIIPMAARDPGIYRLSVAGGSTSAVSQTFLVVDGHV